jgi:opacity protein-like surface antigen
MHGKPFVAAMLLLVLCSFAYIPVSAADEPAKGFEFLAHEQALSHSDSLTLQGGYGAKVWDQKYHVLNTAILLPSVLLPISDVLMEKTIFRGVLQWKFEAVLGLLTTENNRVMAGGCPVGLRYNFTRGNGRFVPYAETTLGIVYLNVHKDIQGTRFNFIETASLGTQYFLSDKVSLDVQARYLHISNAGLHEPNRGQNLMFGIVGVNYYF